MTHQDNMIDAEAVCLWKAVCAKARRENQTFSLNVAFFANGIRMGAGAFFGIPVNPTVIAEADKERTLSGTLENFGDLKFDRLTVDDVCEWATETASQRMILAAYGLHAASVIGTGHTQETGNQLLDEQLGKYDWQLADDEFDDGVGEEFADKLRELVWGRLMGALLCRRGNRHRSAWRDGKPRRNPCRRLD